MLECYTAREDVLFKTCRDSALTHPCAPLPNSIAAIDQHDKAAVVQLRRLQILLIRSFLMPLLFY
jgi:hypothetical protein